MAVLHGNTSTLASYSKRGLDNLAFDTSYTRSSADEMLVRDDTTWKLVEVQDFVSGLGSGGGGSTTFIGLTDTPSNYTASSNSVYTLTLDYVTSSGGPIGNIRSGRIPPSYLTSGTDNGIPSGWGMPTGQRYITIGRSAQFGGNLPLSSTGISGETATVKCGSLSYSGRSLSIVSNELQVSLTSAQELAIRGAVGLATDIVIEFTAFK